MEQRHKREEIEVSTYNYATTASKGEQEPNPLYGNCRNMEQRHTREEIEVSKYNYATTLSKGEQKPNKDQVPFVALLHFYNSRTVTVQYPL